MKRRTYTALAFGILVLCTGITGVAVASHDETTTSATISVTGIEFDERFGSGETAEFWVSVTNETEFPNTNEPLAGEGVTVNITRPDGTVETLTGTTDANGKVVFSYDFAGKPTGTYNLRASSPAVSFSADEQLTSGSQAELFPEFNAYTAVNTEWTAGVTVYDGDQPVESATRDVTVTRPDGTEFVRSVTTNADGYAPVTFTPSQTGDYDLKINGSSRFGPGQVTLEVGTGVSRTQANGEDYADASPEETVPVSGHVLVDGQPMANEDITVAFESFSDTTPRNVTVTTDSTGLFHTTWTTPNVTDTNYEVVLYDDTGMIASDDTRIDVGRQTEQDTTQARIKFDGPFDLTPGDTESYTIQVLDSNDDPVVNTDVVADTRLSQQFLLNTETVTTNATGEAVVDVSVPQNVPTDSIELAATTTVNGSEVIDDEYIGIEPYDDADFDTDFGGAEPGQSQDVTFSISDDSADVSNVPTSIVSKAYEFGSRVMDFDYATTNASGVASLSVDIDDRAKGFVELENQPASIAGYGLLVTVTDFDVTTSSVPDEVGAGSSFDTTVSMGSNAPANGILTVTTYDNVDDQILLSQPVSDGETVTVQVPSDVPDDTDYRVEVFAMDENGDVGENSYTSFDVTADGSGSDDGDTTNDSPTASLTAPSNVTAGQSASFDASGSSDSDGNIITYEWDFDGDGTVDSTTSTATASNTYDSAGTYDVELTVTDDDGATATATETVTVQRAATTEPVVALEPATQTASPGTTATYDLVVENADNGVGSYEFDLAVGNTSVAAISSVDVAGSSAGDTLTTVDVASDGSTATVSVGVADISETGDVTLATVDVDASALGSTDLSVSNPVVGDVDAGSYTINNTFGGELTVGVSAPSVVGDTPAGDLDGDGTYEDVNGDGTFNIVDVSAMFQNRNSAAVQNNAASFDFNGDGTVNIVDVSQLFQQSQS